MSCRKPLLLCLGLMLAACATKATPEDAQMANALCDQGKSLLATSKTGAARDIYTSATTRDPNNPRAWNGLGVTNDLLGKKEEAKEAYQHAYDLAPNDPGIVNNLAHADMEMGDADSAVALLQPFVDKFSSPMAMQQNLVAAQQAAKVKQGGESEVYADLGSYPTQGMAQGHITEARELLNNEDVILSVVPEVKVGGGTPVFTLKATGRPPQAICEDLIAKAFPCVTHGQ